MTAPVKDQQTIRAQWRTRLDRIDAHITQAYVHRHIWRATIDEVVRVNPAADGQFVESYTRVYAESVMLAVRRLADKDDSTHSLWALWAAVRANPQCATRADYVARAVALVDVDDKSSVAAQSDAHFSEAFGRGACVDRDIIERYQSALAADAEHVKDFVDKRIAHLDAIVEHTAAQAIDLSEIHDALDRVADNANHAHRLLDRTHTAYELVVVPPAWRASLQALFPPDEPLQGSAA